MRRPPPAAGTAASILALVAPMVIRQVKRALKKRKMEKQKKR
jgi:hypothetical protein